MADVQISIGLGRKACADFGDIHRASGLVCCIARAACPMLIGEFIFGQIAVDNAANKIGGGRCRCFFG